VDDAEDEDVEEICMEGEGPMDEEEGIGIGAEMADEEDDASEATECKSVSGAASS